MAKLVYLSITSLDGYIEDGEGRFDWSMPTDEVHGFVNDLARPIGTYLYGRRLYEVMSSWQTLDLTGEPPVMHDFAALWRAADKIVYSRTLRAATTPRTRIESDFDPALITELKATADSDLSIGGADLAGQALAAGLVDEVHQLISPIVVGAGKHFLPAGVSTALELADERRFANGVVYLRYRVADRNQA
jgi:dihydrofolate reductase